jgi:hypothetical protein
MGIRGSATHEGRAWPGGNAITIVLSVLLVVSLGLALAAFFLSQRWDAYNERLLTAAASEQAVVHRLVGSAREAGRGSTTAFRHLRGIRQELQSGMALIQGAGPDGRAAVLGGG